MQPRRLSILGVGLLGGSVGLAVKSVLSGCFVAGYGHRRGSLDGARATAAIDEGYADPAAAVRGADLIVLCTPVGGFPQMLAALGPGLAGGAVAADVGA